MGLAVSCDKTNNFGGSNNSLMKKALSRILGFFAGPDRREKSNPVQNRYCICGALMPEEKRREPERSFRTERRLPGFSEHAVK